MTGLTRVTHFVAMRLFFSTKVIRRHRSCPGKGRSSETLRVSFSSAKKKDEGRIFFVWIEDVGKLFENNKHGGCSLSTAKTV